MRESHSIHKREKQNEYFFRIFFFEYKLCFGKNLFLAKIILILQAIENGGKSECSWLEQKSVINIWWVKSTNNVKITEVCNEDREACFSPKYVYK